MADFSLDIRGLPSEWVPGGATFSETRKFTDTYQVGREPGRVCRPPGSAGSIKIVGREGFDRIRTRSRYCPSLHAPIIIHTASRRLSVRRYGYGSWRYDRGTRLN